MLRRRGRPPHPGPLTPAEERVLELVRAGLPNAEIAVRLEVSINSVRFHVSNLLAKAGVESLEELVGSEPGSRRDQGANRRWFAVPALPSGLKLASLAIGAAASVAVVAIGIALTRDSDEPEPVLPALTDLVLPRYAPPVEVNLRGVQGTLVVEGPCLYIDGPGERFLVAFPDGVGQWDEQSRSIRIDALFYPVGSGALPLGGSMSYNRDLPFWLTPPDESCRADQLTFVHPRPGSVRSPSWLPRFATDSDAYIEGVGSGRGYAELLLDDTCAYLAVGSDANEDGAPDRWLLAFPQEGTWWDEGNQALVVGPIIYPVGSKVPYHFLGSGIIFSADQPGFWSTEPAETCDQTHVFAIDLDVAARSRSGEAREYARFIGSISETEADRRLELWLIGERTEQALNAVLKDRLTSVCWEHSAQQLAIVATYTGADSGLDPARAIAATSPVPVIIRTGARFNAADMLHILNDAAATTAPEIRAEFILRCDRIDVEIWPDSTYVGREPQLSAELTAKYGVAFQVRPPNSQ